MKQNKMHVAATTENQYFKFKAMGENEFLWRRKFAYQIDGKNWEQKKESFLSISTLCYCNT